MAKQQRFKMGRKEYLQRLFHEYIQEHHVETADATSVYDWAHKTGRWHHTQFDIRKQYIRELSRALRDERYIDPQGREVRRMHAAPRKLPDGQLAWEWADITTAKPEHMRVSLTVRRDGIVADAWQHFLDTKSYNDNNVHGAALPLFDYDMNKDIAEKQQPEEWPDENPDGEDQSS